MCDCALRIGTQWIAHCTTVFTAASRRSRREAARPGVVGGKLVGASATQDIAAFGLDLLGEDARAPGEVGSDAWIMHAMFAFGAMHRVEGGTDEILRNIIAERVLGLPPEHRADAGPFRDIPTAPAGSVA